MVKRDFSKLKEHEGKVINGIKIIKVLEIENGENRNCECLCHCGRKWNAKLFKLLPGKTESCGCIGRRKTSERSLKHGKCDTRLYIIWRGVIGRCEFDYCTNYDMYGGRGIKINEHWKCDFSNFEKWALENGYKENLTLDRIDVNGNYEPDNCRWVTMKEQNRNKTNTVYMTVGGFKKCVGEWAEITGINYGTIKKRIERGLSHEECLMPAGYFRGKNKKIYNIDEEINKILSKTN